MNRDEALQALDLTPMSGSMGRYHGRLEIELIIDGPRTKGIWRENIGFDDINQLNRRLNAVFNSLRIAECISFKIVAAINVPEEAKKTLFQLLEKLPLPRICEYPINFFPPHIEHCKPALTKMFDAIASSSVSVLDQKFDNRAKP